MKKRTTGRMIREVVERMERTPEYSAGLFKENTALTYGGVLNQIENDLAARQQWLSSETLEHAWTHEIAAITLIELLEVHNCGSTGGFDAGQRDRPNGPNPSLIDRWRWLVARNPDRVKVKK